LLLVLYCWVISPPVEQDPGTSGMTTLKPAPETRNRYNLPLEQDPGKSDMFYYKEWEFKNDESFKNARQVCVCLCACIVYVCVRVFGLLRVFVCASK